MAPHTPAGWYNDGHGQMRWWDGQRWTEHVAPVPTTTTAPVQDSAPVPVVPGVAPAAPHVAERSSAARSPAAPLRVPRFGARKVAQELAAKLDELGAMSIVEIEERIAQAQRELADLHSHIAAANAELQQVRAQLLDVRNTYSLQEVGLYDFAHPAESSATLSGRLEQCRSAIREAVRSGNAVTASQHFTYNNSAAQGRKLIKFVVKGDAGRVQRRGRELRESGAGR